jgi:signal transduction histidine kinase
MPSQRRSASSFLWRALRVVGFAMLFAVALAVTRRQNLWYTLIYSICIGLICWFCIDMGRFAVGRWMHRNSRVGDRDWPGWPWMLVIILIGSAIGYSAGTALVDGLLGQRSANLFDTGSLRESLTLLLFALLPATAITYFFYTRGAVADREALAQAAQRQAAESRLKLLEAQLEPHMLFNTLANLRALITLDPLRAQTMLDQLIAFLRSTLSASRVAEQSLRVEFDRLADYLALIQVRMADRLSVRFDLPDALAEAQVPPLLLQPLVENSIKHGLERAVSGGSVEIGAARDGDFLLLRVRDTGVGLNDAADPAAADRGNVADGVVATRATAFGLAQVRERLATLYGDQASLTLVPAGDAAGGTLAVIRLPLVRA